MWVRAARATACIATDISFPHMASVTRPMLSGADLYDALYASGYHGLRNHTRAGEVLNFMSDTNRTTSLGVRSVLDLGCSHGFAVAALWSMGYIASGVDISSIAVERARQIREAPAGKCVQPCFAQGPATLLPWRTNAFDAIVSSDVLEHVEAADVPAAIRELSRVATRMLVLKIAKGADFVDAKQVRLFQHEKERNRTVSGKSLFASGDLPSNLHPTTHGPDWWIERLRHEGGWREYSRLPTPHGRPWLCCTFVLRRDSPAPETQAEARRLDVG